MGLTGGKVHKTTGCTSNFSVDQNWGEQILGFFQQALTEDLSHLSSVQTNLSKFKGSGHYW